MYPLVMTSLLLVPRGDDGSSSERKKLIEEFFGEGNDLQLLRPFYAATVYSPLVLLGKKQLATRKQSALPLSLLYHVRVFDYRQHPDI